MAGKVMLLGFGAQKAGTSWLHRHICKDSGTFGSPVKEVHFFDRWLRPDLTQDVRRIMTRLTATTRSADQRDALREHRRMVAEPATYLDYFAHNGSAAARFIDLSPAYALLERDDLLVVRDYFAAAGLAVIPFFIMRDPAARLISQQRSMKGVRGARYDLPRGVEAALANPLYVARSRYDLTLPRLWEVFGKDRVVCGFYETLFADPDRALHHLTDQLGVPWHAPKPERRVNRSGSHDEIPSALTARVRQRFAATHDFVEQHFGADVPADWQR